MDTLHQTLNAIRGESKTSKDHLSVFREFLDRLDQMQRKAPPSKPTPVKSQPRRKAARRTRG